MQEENHLLVIEETDEGAVNIALLNLAVDGSDDLTAVRELMKNDPSSVVVLLIPGSVADKNVIAEGIKVGGRAYIEKPISGEEIKKRLSRILIRSEGK